MIGSFPFSLSNTSGDTMSTNSIALSIVISIASATLFEFVVKPALKSTNQGT